MNFNELDSMIDRLLAIMPDAPDILGIDLRRHDWRSVWSLAKEIQEGFNFGVRYPTKELRQEAWKKFNQLRTEASKRADLERDLLRSKSEQHKSYIFSECNGIGYSRVVDALFFFDPTTVSDMKARGKYLSNVMRYFKEHKDQMIGEHKKECFDRIQMIKEQHEDFWRDHHEAHELRKGDRARRIEENLAKNREMYRRTVDALERFQDKASGLREKISDSNSEKWTGIWSEWLSETESKIEDIEAQLRRIEGWIEENEEQLRKLR